MRSGFRINRRPKFATAALTAVLFFNAVPPPAARAAVPSPEWGALQQFAPAILERWARVASPNSEGAVSVNKDGGYINVGFQRESVDQIPYAVMTKNRAAIDSALSILQYAFARENPNGSFEYAERNSRISSGAAPSALGEASAEAFFLYDAGHSLLLLRQSPWFQNDSALAPERRTATRLESGLATALSWLVNQSVVLDSDRAALNRRFVYAAAYLLPGLLLHRQAAIALGTQFLGDALARQLPDGTFPESGGFDSSYQAVSLYLASLLYLQLPGGSRLHQRLAGAIARATAREAKSIASNGEVSTSGDTRTGKESYFGHVKQVDSRMVILSLEYASVITGSAEVRNLAERVFKRYH